MKLFSLNIRTVIGFIQRMKNLLDNIKRIHRFIQIQRRKIFKETIIREIYLYIN